ncbi:hypothetical protein CPB83DRAFT_841141 [Crepidotus variabilis]|uniref:Uncharacterized protein n=1 Tax=Crepidotus variabilis TaxID=179855 RepID=A0A9P6E320_9AGAR|nr:hypothetical protein CPB83DRAFT_841141 [Crepidotus variabilis]
MKDKTEPPTKPRSITVGQSMSTQQTEDFSVSAQSTGQSSDNGGPPSMSGSKVRLHTIQMALMETQVRAAAQRASECAEEERIATANRLEADRQASLALQRFYIAQQAHENAVAKLLGPPQQLSDPANYLLQSPSACKLKPYTPINLHSSSGLGSVIFEQETAHRGQQRNKKSSAANKSTAEKPGRGKEKAQNPSPIASGTTKSNLFVISPITGPPATQVAALSISPGIASSPSTTAPRPSAHQHLSNDVRLSPPKHSVVKRGIDENSTTSPKGKELEITIATVTERLARPLRHMDGASPRIPIGGPSNQTVPQVAIDGDDGLNNSFAAFPEEASNELNDFYRLCLPIRR